jgi:anaerobic magnesium-protoporphyrin IX monomethyl ester cyclase
MLKVALINPPQFTRYPQPPLGLAMIAAVLEKAGYQVTVIDANVSGVSLASIPSRVAGVDIVGITAMTPTIGTAMDIALHLQQLKPAPRVVLGGAHPSLLPEETLAASPGTDVIVRGEGEDTFLELLKAIEDGLPLREIAGLSYREDSKNIHTPDRTSCIEMDRLPYPAYELLPWSKYRPHPPHGMAKPFAAMVTSRGCPYRCAYCSKPVFGSRYRAQSPARVVDEMAYLRDRFGVKEIAFYDDSFTIDKERVLAIAEKLTGSGIKVAWTCETRVNLVDNDLLRNMKRAGCYAVAYGIESASPEIIKALQKDITLEQVEKAVRESHEAGLQVIGYFMFGSPGETPDTIQQTIDFALKLKVDFAQFSVTTPFPGTELYEIYTHNVQESVPWESFVYAGTDNPTTPVFESDKLSRDALTAWIKEAYRQFYMRPSYIWQRVKKTTSLSGLKTNMKGFRMLRRNVR